MSSEYLRPYGRTSIALSSENPRRSAQFYAAVLDEHEVHHDDSFVRIASPRSNDITVFERGVGSNRLEGMAHYGFKFSSPKQVESAAAKVRASGGEVVELGEFSEGEPYLFVRDPDGYLFEIWYEA